MAGALLASGFGPVEHARRGFSDWMVRHAPKPKPPLKFALLLIDSSSLDLDHLPPEELAESSALQAMAEGFPWSRVVYAEAIRKILDAGARLVILDILLPPGRPGDEELKGVLAEYPGRVVLVSNFVEDVSGDGHVIVRYQEPFDGDVPAGTVVGFANFWRHQDGVVRAAPFRLYRPGGDAVYSSPAAALGIVAGEAAKTALPDEALFIPCMEGLAPDVRLPLWQLFSPATWEANLRSGEVFRGRAVAIGASAPQFHDEFTTPVGTVVGAGLHLGVLGAAMERAFYTDQRQWAAVLGGVLGAFCSWLAWTLVVSPGLRGGVLVVTATLAVLASLLAVSALGWMPPTFGLLVGISFAGVSTLGSDLVAEGRERRRARRILERYVSPEVAREILDNRSAFLSSLGGARREVVVLFSDIRGFTAKSEHGDPSNVFEELNEYFGLMVEEILETGGWVDKFMGDGILAAWGALPRRTHREEAAAAVHCTSRMLAALVGLNAVRVSRGQIPWKLGIGVHDGEVLFGNLGSKAKMAPTVIGDTVNLASRIEGYTKTLGVQVLYSAAVLASAGLENTMRSADRVRLLGRTQATDLFTLWPDDFTSANRAAHEEAIALYRKGEFSQAAKIFASLAAEHPDDPLAALYVARCSVERPADWTGVTEAVAK